MNQLRIRGLRFLIAISKEVMHQGTRRLILKLSHAKIINMTKIPMNK